MPVCKPTYAYTYTYTYTYTYAVAYAYSYAYVYTPRYMYMYTDTCTQTDTAVETTACKHEQLVADAHKHTKHNLKGLRNLRRLGMTSSISYILRPFKLGSDALLAGCSTPCFRGCSPAGRIRDALRHKESPALSACLPPRGHQFLKASVHAINGLMSRCQGNLSEMCKLKVGLAGWVERKGKSCLDACQQLHK